jgi:hypothetical protein
VAAKSRIVGGWVPYLKKLILKCYYHTHDKIPLPKNVNGAIALCTVTLRITILSIIIKRFFFVYIKCRNLTFLLSVVILNVVVLGAIIQHNVTQHKGLICDTQHS